jgi:hypothetical protein
MDSLTALATTGFNDAWTFVLNFLAFILIAGALFAWSLRSGRSALVAFVFSLYAGYALYAVFPYASSIIGAAGSALTALFLKVVLYGVFTGLAYWAIRRHGGGDYFGGRHWVSAILAILASGFILAVLYHTLGAKGAYSFTPSIDALFAPKDYFFWWFVAPLAGVLLLAR